VLFSFKIPFGNYILNNWNDGNAECIPTFQPLVPAGGTTSL